MRWCGMNQMSSDSHIWGECPRCGRVAGIISRESIRRYIDAEAKSKAFMEQQESLRRSIIMQSKSRS
jgi:hypothetical protein